MDQIRPKWTEIDKIGPKWMEVDRNFTLLWLKRSVAIINATFQLLDITYIVAYVLLRTSLGLKNN